MARTTISDALELIPNKYELGMLASQRVRDLNGGEPPVVSVENDDRPAVTALREIASGRLDIDGLREEFVQSYRRVPTVDESDETLESNAAAPELKELDAELAGEAAGASADKPDFSETAESIEIEEVAVEETIS
jgi:DNA-directed RNA polymerase subunit omega